MDTLTLDREEMKAKASPRIVIRATEVADMTGYSASWVYAAHKMVPGFPERVKLGPGSCGWFLDEIEEWLNSRERGVLCEQRPRRDPQPQPRRRRVMIGE